MDPLIRIRMFDGSWWEVELPDDWICKRDRSIKGWPILFQSTNGSRLTIQTASYDYRTSKSEIADVYREFPLDRQKEDFIRYLDNDAKGKVEIQAAQQDFFCFKRYATPELSERWLVQFSGCTWKVWAKFLSDDTNYAEDSVTAVKIMKSVNLFEPHV